MNLSFFRKDYKEIGRILKIGKNFKIKRVKIWQLKLVNGVMVQDMILILTVLARSAVDQEKLITKIIFKNKGIKTLVFFIKG